MLSSVIRAQLPVSKPPTHDKVSASGGMLQGDLQCPLYEALTSTCTDNLSTLTDEQIVHRAARILRERMSKCKTLADIYNSPDEMNLDVI